MNLKMYFNMWKINDVLDHIKGHVTLTIENVFKVFMYFKNINLKNKMTGKLDQLKNNKQKHFPAIPFSICEEEQAKERKKEFSDMYKHYRIPLMKPLIWGKEFPKFFKFIYVYKYEDVVGTFKKKSIKKSTKVVKRRKSMKTLLSIDLERFLNKDQYDIPESPTIKQSKVTDKNSNFFIENKFNKESNEDLLSLWTEPMNGDLTESQLRIVQSSKRNKKNQKSFRQRTSIISPNSRCNLGDELSIDSRMSRRDIPIISTEKGVSIPKRSLKRNAESVRPIRNFKKKKNRKKK